MKKIILLTLCVLFIAQAVNAENFISVKFGQAQYKEEKDSQWEGSHIYEGNEVYGLVIGYKKDNWIYRLDIEKFRTGTELSNTFPIAYDGVRINQYPIILSIGRSLGMFYGLIGAGYIINDAEFWQYAPYPFDAKMNNSPCLALTLGIEKNITKNLYGFLEGQYIYSKATVKIQEYSSFKEDISNLITWLGLGWKF